MTLLRILGPNVVAIEWVKEGRVLPLTLKNLPNIGKKRKKLGKRGKNRGEKDKYQEASFTFLLLTNRAGYTTAGHLL